MDPGPGNMNLFDPANKMEKLSLRWLDSDNCFLTTEAVQLWAVSNSSRAWDLEFSSPYDEMESEKEMVVLRISFSCLFPTQNSSKTGENFPPHPNSPGVWGRSISFI